MRLLQSSSIRTELKMVTDLKGTLQSVGGEGVGWDLQVLISCDPTGKLQAQADSKEVIARNSNQQSTERF